MVFSSFAREPITIIKGEAETSYSAGYPQHVHQPLVETVVQDILGKGTCVSSGVSGARTNWVLEEILGTGTPE